MSNTTENKIIDAQKVVSTMRNQLHNFDTVYAKVEKENNFICAQIFSEFELEITKEQMEKIMSVFTQEQLKVIKEKVKGGANWF